MYSVIIKSYFGSVDEDRMNKSPQIFLLLIKSVNVVCDCFWAASFMRGGGGGGGGEDSDDGTSFELMKTLHYFGSALILHSLALSTATLHLYFPSALQFIPRIFTSMIFSDVTFVQNSQCMSFDLQFIWKFTSFAFWTLRFDMQFGLCSFDIGF